MRYLKSETIQHLAAACIEKITSQLTPPLTARSDVCMHLHHIYSCWEGPGLAGWRVLALETGADNASGAAMLWTAAFLPLQGKQRLGLLDLLQPLFATHCHCSLHCAPQRHP